MGPHEGVCAKCGKAATLGCTEMCFKCSTGDDPPPTSAIEEVQTKMKRGSDYYLDVVVEKAQARREAQRTATISTAEHATILAALTFWRQCRLESAGNRPPIIHEIATNGGTLPHVNEEKMRLLLDRLNGAEIIKVRPHDTRPLGTNCAVCGEPQFATPSGPICRNQHGGARALAPGEKPGGVVPEWAFTPEPGQGAALRRRREMSTLSLGDLAREMNASTPKLSMNVSTPLLSDLERGKIDPQWPRFTELLQRAFNIVNARVIADNSVKYPEQA